MVFGQKLELPRPGEALPGRETPMPVPNAHFVNGRPLRGPFPDGLKTALFGLGCFWGAERKFWQTEGVWSTAVGYAGGETPNPTYQETCTGRTGHTEIVLVVYDPARVSYEALLKVFWENHDPHSTDRRFTPLTRFRWPQLQQQETDIRTLWPGRGEGRSRQKSEWRQPSTMPRSTISSISRRIRAGIADWAGRACRVRSASACRRTNCLQQA